ERSINALGFFHRRSSLANLVRDRLPRGRQRLDDRLVGTQARKLAQLALHRTIGTLERSNVVGDATGCTAYTRRRLVERGFGLTTEQLRAATGLRDGSIPIGCVYDQV